MDKHQLNPQVTMHRFILVLFKQQKKHLPVWLENTFLSPVLRLGVFVFLSAWFFQGILYMDKREITIKFIFDAIFTIAIMFAGVKWWVSFLIAHSLNFIFNGQFLAMYTHMGAISLSVDDFLNYIISCQKRLEKYNFIDVAIAFGSLSRGVYKSTSDLDIRIIPKKGCLNWIKAVFWAVTERIRAFFWQFPLDLYIFELDTIIEKMRSDEPPILLVNKIKGIETVYPNFVTFDLFKEVFISQNKQ